MARIIVAAVLSLLVLANLTPHSAGSPSFTPNVSDATVWRLVWSDEFNGPNGSGVDTAKWVPETGGSGWGNNELEYYTNRLQNADIENGSLAIKALKETYTGPDNVTRSYTSARLKTQTKFSLSYGRIEARLKVTYGQGMWPAFWMLGSNIDQVG
jgi:beta-glucanase (GH16 family)